MTTRTIGIAIAIAALAIGVIAAGVTPRPGPLRASVPKTAINGEGEQGTARLSPDAPTEVSAPVVQRSKRPAVFDGDVRNLPPEPPTAPLLPTELKPPGDTSALSGTTVGDPRVQASTPSTPAPAPSGGIITGIGRQEDGNTFGWPPDTNMDVGANHVVEVVNTGIAIFDKSTRARLSFMTLNTLIDGTNTPCDGSNQGDPIVLYDTFADRWIVTDFAWDPAKFTTGPFYQCFAVSQTSNPVVGGWYFYAVETASTALLADYEKLGVWPDGIYMTANMFNTTPATTYSNVRVWAFNRTDLESGAMLRSVRFDLPQKDSGAVTSGALPSNARLQTGTPPAGRPNYISTINEKMALQVWRFAVDWATPVSSTISASSSDIPITPFPQPPETAPTPKNSIDTFGSSLMVQNQYTNIGGVESLWVTHSVGTSSDYTPPANIRWYQFGLTGDVLPAAPLQSSTWAPPDGLNRFLPTLAVNRLGDMALGYSIAASGTNPGIRYAGRLAGDPASTLGFGEQTLVDGGGSQTISDRWGDYAAMAVDPSDGCTFWLASEVYAADGGDWGTRIGSFTFPSCAPPTVSSAPAVSPSEPTTVGTTLTSTRGAWNGVSNTYAYEWQRNGGTGWTAIASAEAASYTAVDADAGASVRCLVTATNPIGNASSASNTITIAALAAPAGAPTSPAQTPTARIRAPSVPPMTVASLAKGLPVTFRLSQPAKVTIVVRVRGKIIGTIRKSVASGKRTLRITISNTWRKTAKKGDVLVMRISGQTTIGGTLVPTSIRTTLR